MAVIGCFAPISSVTLKHLHDNPHEVPGFLFPEDGHAVPPGTVDIDEVWDGLHFLLGRQHPDFISPESLAVMGGIKIGDDLGHGPARVLTPAAVRIIALCLEEMSPDHLAMQYDPVRMDSIGVYPETWRQHGEDGLEYIMDGYQRLFRFYHGARLRCTGMILWLE